MTDASILVGRVLRANTAGFTIGTKVLEAGVPSFGSFVKVFNTPTKNNCEVIGLISNVSISDDPFIRQLAVPDIDEEIIADHRENRLSIEVSVLVVGFFENGRVHQYLPAQPPIALEKIVTCSRDEISNFTNDLAFLRTILNSKDSLTDELLAAALRLAAEAHGSGGRDFLVRAGRELSRLLAFDSIRLEGLLRRIKPQ